MYQHLARLLVIAYREHGGDELSQVIADCAGDLSSADRRIQAVYNALDDSLPAVTVVSEGPPPQAPTQVTTPAPTQVTAEAPTQVTAEIAPADGARVEKTVRLSVESYEADRESDAYSGEGAQAAPPQSAAPAVPSKRQPEPPPPPPANAPPPVPARPPAMAPPTTVQPAMTQPMTAPPAWPATSPAAARSPVFSVRSPGDAPRLYVDESQRDQAEETPPAVIPPTTAPATLSALLAMLSAGPASRGFESAFQALCAKNFQSGPQDRAVARSLIRDRGWYVDVFRPYDQEQFQDLLVMIFWHAVIPDLGERQVVREIASWAGTLAAPAAVIRALYASTVGASGTRPLMDQALKPVLAERWLNEYGIQPAAAASPPAPDQGGGPPDQGGGAWDQGGGAWDQGGGSPEPGPRRRGVTAPQAAAQPSDGPLTLQNLVDRKVTMPVPLVLVIGIVVIVLLLVAR